MCTMFQRWQWVRCAMVLVMAVLYGETLHSRPVYKRSMKLLPRAQVSSWESSLHCASCGVEWVDDKVRDEIASPCRALDWYATTDSHSVRLRIAPSLRPNELSAWWLDLGVVLASSSPLALVTFWIELIIAVVSLLVIFLVVISETLCLVPPISPFRSRSFLILSRSSNDNFSHSVGE